MRRDPAETITHPSGLHALIMYDDDAQNPRLDCDHAFTLTCIHDRYNLGDPHTYNGVNSTKPSWQEYKSADDIYRSILGADEFDRLSALDDKEYCRIERTPDILGGQKEAHKQRARDHAERIRLAIAKACPIFEPLYLYDHSGITISLGSFTCPWDSGCVGFAYITRADILHEWGTKRKAVTKEVLAKARTLLEAEVEEYDNYLTGQVFGIVIEDPSGDELESCWGFNGLKYTQEEAQRMLDSCAKQYAIDQEALATRASFAATSGGD